MGKMVVFQMHGAPVTFSVFLDNETLWKQEYCSNVRNSTDIFYSLAYILYRTILKTSRKLQPQITRRLALKYQTIAIWQKCLQGKMLAVQFYLNQYGNRLSL